MSSWVCSTCWTTSSLNGWIWLLISSPALPMACRKASLGLDVELCGWFWPRWPGRRTVTKSSLAAMAVPFGASLQADDQQFLQHCFSRPAEAFLKPVGRWFTTNYCAGAQPMARETSYINRDWFIRCMHFCWPFFVLVGNIHKKVQF